MKKEEVDKILNELNESKYEEVFEMFDMHEGKEIVNKINELIDEEERVQDNETQELEKYEQEFEKLEQELEILMARLLEKIEKKLGKENEAYFYQNISTEYFKYLKNEKQKIAQLDRIDNRTIKKERIFEKIEQLSDEEKLELLSNIESKFNINKIVETIKNKEIRIRALPFIQDQAVKIDIIDEIDDANLRDKKYVELLENKKDLGNNLIIQLLISKITDPKTRDDQIMKVLHYKETENIKSDSNERYNKFLIAKISDYELQKAEIMKSRHSTDILCHIKDCQRAIDMLDLIEKKKDKYQVIQSILQKDISYADLLAQKMNDENIKKIAKNSWESKKERTLDAIGIPPEITIGIEIEANEQEEIYSKLLKNETVDGVTRGRKIYKYFVKDEASADIEVVSPILHDNEQDVNSIYDVCETLQNLGYEVLKNCGAHVHIGLDYLNSKRAIENVYEIWGGTEAILHKICNENGELPRSNIYAQPYSRQFSRRLKDLPSHLDREEFIYKLRQIQQGSQEQSKNKDLVLSYSAPTLEFRMANGTLDPKTWIDNIRLYGRIIQRAKEVADLEQKLDLTEEEKRKKDLFQKLKDEMPEQEKLDCLLELLFEEKEKETYKRRYDLVTEKLNDLEERGEENPFKEKRKLFGIVDFKKIYEQRGMFQDIVNKLLDAGDEKSQMQKMKETNEERI